MVEDICVVLLFGAQSETSVAQVAIKRNWHGVWELWSVGWMKLAQQAPHSITPTLLYSISRGGRGYSGLLQHDVVHVLANGAIGSGRFHGLPVSLQIPMIRLCMTQPPR
jgi:hypothetical protein